jgi:NitT/TauT family transport system permease protein
MNRRVFVTTIQILVIGLVIGLWQLLADTNVLDKEIFSSPTEIVAAGGKLITQAKLYIDFETTLEEIIIAFALALVAGVVFGCIIAEVDPLYNLLYVPILVLYALPTIALFPVYVLFFGIGMLQRVIFAASWGIFPILVNTIAGRRSVPAILLSVGRSLGASRQEIWRKIAFPATLPLVATGLRIGIVYTILGVLVSELLISTSGVGAELVLSSRHFQMPEYYLYVFIISVTSLLLAYVVSRVERYFERWRM